MFNLFSTLFFFLTLSLVVSEVIVLQVSKTLCAQPWCKLSIAMKIVNLLL